MEKTLKFFNLHCDLDLEPVIPFFSQDTLVYADVPEDQVWLPKNQHFRRYNRKKSSSDHMSPCSNLDLEDSKQISLHDTLAHDVILLYQVW